MTVLSPLDSPFVRLFAVGGCIRDELLGLRTKDWDFAVEAESFEAMRHYLVCNRYTIFVETPEYLTIRAHFPKGHPEHGRTTADFVLCRKDVHIKAPLRSTGSVEVSEILPDGSEVIMPIGDGRHPDGVVPGTIFDDLARRDFTVNAMARSLDTGLLLDPHGGQRDLRQMVLRFVGDPHERIREDALRVLRAVRFVITKGFRLDLATREVLGEPGVGDLLASVSTERIKDELEKCFRVDTIATMRELDSLGLFDTLFQRAGIRLTTTLKS